MPLKSTSLLGPSPGTWIKFPSRTHEFSNQTFSLDKLLLWIQKEALPFCLFSHAFNWIPCQFMDIAVDLFYMIRKQVFKYALCIKYHIYSAGKEKHCWSTVILQTLVSNKFSQLPETALASSSLLSGLCTTSLSDMSNLYQGSWTPKAVLIGRKLVRLNCHLLSGKDVWSDIPLLLMTQTVLSLWMYWESPVFLWAKMYLVVRGNTTRWPL